MIKTPVQAQIKTLHQEHVDKLIAGNHHDPHQYLGLFPYKDNKKIIRLWRPGASKVYIEFFGDTLQMCQTHSAGVFELIVPETTEPQDYLVYHQNGMLDHDPYAFYPTFAVLDQYLFAKGVHYELYETMGGRLIKYQGTEGAKFAVWAPNASSVSLIGDFNYWNGRANPMRSLGGCGVWELYVPGLKEGDHYKFEIQSENGDLRVKADPYALSSELRPQTASVLFDVDKFDWADHKWMRHRSESFHEPKPMNAYEVHLGSWNRQDGEFLNYREIAHRLAAYCQKMGFTHVELMPIAEHPLDESWGYQVTGFFAVTSRFGTPRDFQYFVDHLHQNNIGVILDWVPGHFPTDDFALSRFDGTHLYEHSDPRQGFHPHWSTSIFNYKRMEVSNFLIANALFFLEKMHIDGLRVDAVASMLYLDYGREDGEWVANAHGGKENLDAIEFLKHMNSVVHDKFPGVLTIAEESTSFPTVSCPVGYGGLGFDMKWNMGWMNDTLSYFERDPIHRKYHQDDLTFCLLYAFTERFVSVLSHDEVVHGKRSLLSKMPGDVWQKFANMRLLYTYMLCQPGKNLLFMGGEFGQWDEWDCKREIDWPVLDYPLHQGLSKLVQEMNHFVIDHSALWERDFDWTGFQWIDFADTQNSVIAYRRKSQNEECICVHNFTPTYHGEYQLNLPGVKALDEIFNSDDERYGGSGKKAEHIALLPDGQGSNWGVEISIAPLATMIFKVEY